LCRPYDVYMKKNRQKYQCDKMFKLPSLCFNRIQEFDHMNKFKSLIL
jgi:hypothetical protein